jgi:hypothetical protein
LNPIIHTPYAVSVRMSRDFGSLHYWQCSNWITTMLRQPGDSKIQQEKNVTGNFLWKSHWRISLLVWYGNSAQGQTNRPAERIPVTHARLVGKSQCSRCVCEENAMLDFVEGSVLKCSTQNWITGSKSENFNFTGSATKPLYRIFSNIIRTRIQSALRFWRFLKRKKVSSWF